VALCLRHEQISSVAIRTGVGTSSALSKRIIQPNTSALTERWPGVPPSTERRHPGGSTRRPLGSSRRVRVLVPVGRIQVREQRPGECGVRRFTRLKRWGPVVVGHGITVEGMPHRSSMTMTPGCCVLSCSATSASISGIDRTTTATCSPIIPKRHPRNVPVRAFPDHGGAVAMQAEHLITHRAGQWVRVPVTTL
jgi:hypothetical protein